MSLILEMIDHNYASGCSELLNNELYKMVFIITGFGLKMVFQSVVQNRTIITVYQIYDCYDIRYGRSRIID